MNNNILCNVDTDSFSIMKPDGSPWTEQELKDFTDKLNAEFPELIEWADDGVYDKFIIAGSKNYIMKVGDKVTLKGSSMKDQKKPKIFLQFIKEIVDYLLSDRQHELVDLYKSYCRKTKDIQDISVWAKKVTVTDKVLNPTRTNEQKILDALHGKKVQQGDKIYVFFKSDSSLCLVEDFNGDYKRDQLLKNLLMCMDVFDSIVDMNQFLNYSLKRNKKALEELDNEIG